MFFILPIAWFYRRWIQTNYWRSCLGILPNEVLWSAVEIFLEVSHHPASTFSNYKVQRYYLKLSWNHTTFLLTRFCHHLLYPSYHILTTYESSNILVFPSMLGIQVQPKHMNIEEINENPLERFKMKKQIIFNDGNRRNVHVDRSVK